MSCPDCKSTHVVKLGKRLTRKRAVQKYQCQKCGRNFQDQYSYAQKIAEKAKE